MAQNILREAKNGYTVYLGVGLTRVIWEYMAHLVGTHASHHDQPLQIGETKNIRLLCIVYGNFV